MTANISRPPAQHVLSSQDWQARVDERGAALVALSYQGIELVAGTWSHATEWFAGSTLAPWVNRLEDGQWVDASGVTHTAAINDVANGCANHGLVFSRNFNVSKVSISSITLSTSCFDASAYPFEMLLEVTYSLGSSGLSVLFELKNLSEVRAPFSIGSHPYLVAESDSVLTFAAKTVFVNDDNMLPLKKVDLGAAESKVRIRPAHRGDFTDTCFAQLETNALGKHEIRLSRPSMRKDVVLSQSEELSHLQVFTLQAPELTGYEALVALEPQTAPANALRSSDGLLHLEPGERFASSWGVHLEDSKND